MKRYLLDTSALLTLRDDEAGADRVADLLGQAQRRKVECVGCFMSQMELLYRVWRDEDEARAQMALQQCLALPIRWVHESEALLRSAAAVKAQYPLSVADAWIAAAAELEGAVLIHKDPEFASVPVPQEMLPLKVAAGSKRQIEQT